MSSNPIERPRRDLGAPAHRLAAALFALLLAAAAAGGADFTRYEDWGIAALSGSLDHARVYTISPLGVPLMMWAHGTGFVFATAELLTGGLVDFRAAAMIGGWLGALVLWAAMLRMLWIGARGDRVLVLLGAGLFFVATHGGYFSHVHASESLGLACAGVLGWLALERSLDERAGLVAAGLTSAFLLLVKPYWVLYAAGAVVALLLRARRRGRPAAALFGGLALAAVPVAVATLQTALANRWMTGSPWQSSYQFGDAGFRSFDFVDPELAAVLVHPWHGLLSNHPFYLLGAIAMIAVAWRSESSERRVLFGAGLLAMLANLWIQAAWVVWWLGKGTFGMRGMAPAAALVVPAFVIVAARLQERRSPLLWAWTGGGIVCALWSAPLLLAGVEPQFYTYGQMLAGQAVMIRHLGVLGGLVPLAALFGLLAWLFSDVWRGAGRAAPLALCALGLGALALLYLAREALWVFRSGTTLTALVAALVVPALLVVSARIGAEGAAARWLPAILVVAQAALFVLASILFFRLAVNLEADIAAGRGPARNYAYVNTFSTRDMRESCNEYRHLPAFADKRDAFKAFLIRHGVEPSDFRF